MYIFHILKPYSDFTYICTLFLLARFLESCVDFLRKRVNALEEDLILFKKISRFGFPFSLIIIMM